MPRQIQDRPSKPLILSLSISLILAGILAIAPLLANATETTNAATETVPDASMDRSKMEGMKDRHTMKDMSDLKGMSTTGDVDYDFAVNMRVHHQMAVDMSQAQLKNGKSPKLRAMAISIIAAQKKEIAQLDRWIKATKKPVPISK